ncbi:hypothetical protein H4696_003390 [Amycolatopsis lexingtonensis]|uniref:Uncharacterized protein n=1 Tax=Amycolatopsis lexingtonensis TaxID=218822 RepID=A0ABR9HZC9_9PSEU|nr:hypothetical protein [Amycolatopsis lexingtonensis]MBE1496290.1 hypothetical protein [Amycolatopsis lexingtonensis]
MNGRSRRVLVQVEHRTATLSESSASPGDSQPSHRVDELYYPGILVSHLQDGVVDHEMWLPMGETPTLADEEALIAALHAAMRWNRGELPEHLRTT